MNLRIVTEPTVEPVSVEDAMAHCRADSADQTYVEALIPVARQMAEKYTERALAVATYELRLDDFASEIPLIAPVQSVESVKYIDSDGVEQTVDADVYTLDDNPDASFIRLAYGKSWPAPRVEANAVRVQFVSGYTVESPNTHPLPKPLYQAMLMIIGHLYTNRQDVSDKQAYEVPLASSHLMTPYRLGMGL